MGSVYAFFIGMIAGAVVGVIMTVAAIADDEDRDEGIDRDGEI